MLVLPVGIPACGKSSLGRVFANSKVWQGADPADREHSVVSTDATRLLMTGKVWAQEENQAVFDVVERIVRARIRNKLDVYVDATNLPWREDYERANYIDYALDYGHEVFTVLFDTSFTDCVRRNNARSQPVPMEVMTTMRSRMEQVEVGSLYNPMTPAQFERMLDL